MYYNRRQCTDNDDVVNRNESVRAYATMLSMDELRVLTPRDYTAHHLGALHELPHVPTQLWLRGQPPPETHRLLSVVGSRDYTTYGKQVVQDLLAGLRGYPIGIISGLARGIDGLAHDAALAAELYTLAIPGSGLDSTVLYPRRHLGLATRILQASGGLLSELPPTTKATKWTFPARNRLMAGLAHATLLIEATERSGTLITARLAVEYNRELLVVPGNIFSPQSLGTHQFLKLGATPITSSADILEVLGLSDATPCPSSLSDDLPTEHQRVLSFLTPNADFDALLTQSHISPEQLSIILMELEINGLITFTNGLYHRRI